MGIMRGKDLGPMRMADLPKTVEYRGKRLRLIFDSTDVNQPTMLNRQVQARVDAGWTHIVMFPFYSLRYGKSAAFYGIKGKRR